MSKTTKPLTFSGRDGNMTLFFAKEKLTKLIHLIDVIIDANSERYTHTLALLNERCKCLPAFMNVSDTDDLLDILIDATHELTNIIKNSNHANYFLDQNEMNLYSAFKLIDSIQYEINRFENV